MAQEVDAPEPQSVDLLAGVPEGTVLVTPDDAPNEKVVGDYDDEGNLVGWHKEAA